jgi:hypothetical protein
VIIAGRDSRVAIDQGVGKFLSVSAPFHCHINRKQVLIKGGGDEEIYYVGNGFSYDGCIHWRMLDRVGRR